MDLESVGNIIMGLAGIVSFFFLGSLVISGVKSFFAWRKRKMDKAMPSGDMLKYHLASAMRLIREGNNKDWYELDPDITLAMATVAGVFLHGPTERPDTEDGKKAWDAKQKLLREISICPCCYRTFHEVVVRNEVRVASFPPGVFEKVNAYLKGEHPQKASAIRLLMLSLDIKLDLAKDMVRNWDKINK